MAYAYWSNGKHADRAVFDLFFRKHPFDGRYCVFAGLDEVLKYVANFRWGYVCRCAVMIAINQS